MMKSLPFNTAKNPIHMDGLRGLDSFEHQGLAFSTASGQAETLMSLTQSRKDFSAVPFRFFLFAALRLFRHQVVSLS